MLPNRDVPIDSVIAFEEKVDQLMTSNGGVETEIVIFRGQSDKKWGLIPSLGRFVLRDAKQWLVLEKRLLTFFRARAHVHIPAYDLPDHDDLANWWALMQHHRVPTRLLDWTASAYVAAYFAVSCDLDRDGVVHVTAPTFFRDINSTKEHRKVVGLRPKRPSPRMIAQQGSFLLTEAETPDLGAMLDADAAQCVPTARGYSRLIIPAALKVPLLQRLRSMNVTAASLFPGIDGLGLATQELAGLIVASGSVHPTAEDVARLWAERDRESPSA